MSQPGVSVGGHVGSYEIVAPLRAGGMASLYLARRVGPAGFSRPVAIKVVHAHLASDRSFVDMFLDEARLSARIAHPNVVHVEELGEHDGMFFLAMEYVHGISLSVLLKRLVEARRMLSPAVAVAIAMKVADGLHAAHEAKDPKGEPLEVIHRDVSPQNVLVSLDGHVKLIDFGVARARGRLEETEAGSLKGKLRYMAPEQAWGRAIDRRIDVYALGVVLWEMLTARRLFRGESEMDILERVRSPKVELPSTFASDVSARLDEVVLTALAPEVGDRFESAQAFRRALGNACPDALAVEPDELGFLVASLGHAELETERSLLTTLGEAPRAPAEAEVEEGVTRLTRAITGSASFSGVEAGETPAPPEVTRAARPSARAPGPRVEPAAPPRRWAPIVGATLALLIGSGGAYYAMAYYARGASENAAAPAPLSETVAFCSALEEVRGEDGVTRSISLDSREGATGLFPLRSLRSAEAEPAPSVAVRYRVPGEGPRAVELSTVNAGTDSHFDTVLAVFRGDCADASERAYPDWAIDDAAPGRESRSEGAFAAQGGELLTIVVTGYGAVRGGRVDRGLLQLDITPRASAPSELLEASATLAGGLLVTRVSASDPDGDTDGLALRLLDPAGDAIGVPVYGGEDDPPIEDLKVRFDHPARGATSLTESATLQFTSEALPALARASHVEITVLDRPGNASAPRRVPLQLATLASAGEPCDDTHVCATELSCGSAGRCVPAGERIAACEAATPLGFRADGDGFVLEHQGVIPVRPGLFTAACAPLVTGGAEEILEITVPEGRWDLIAETTGASEHESTFALDTILYFRRDCVDPSPASAPVDWCNDDLAIGENMHSRVTLPTPGGGSIFAFVELWSGASYDADGARYTLSISLRPSAR